MGGAFWQALNGFYRPVFLPVRIYLGVVLGGRAHGNSCWNFYTVFYYAGFQWNGERPFCSDKNANSFFDSDGDFENALVFGADYADVIEFPLVLSGSV